MKKAVQVVLINDKGEILAVSRKDNHEDMGLIGGKVDPEDNDDIYKAAIRETKEETGLDIYDLELIFAIHKYTRMQYTFLAKYKGEVFHNEPHAVKWCDFNEVIKGSFGEFNKLVGKSLDSMGVKYLKYPKVSEPWMFAVCKREWGNSPYVVVTPINYYKKHNVVPTLYENGGLTNKQLMDFHYLCENGNINLRELDETSYEVIKDKKFLETREEIIKAMTDAGFIFDNEFDREMNSFN